MAEISTAGTSTVPAMSGEAGIGVPGRAKTTIRASAGSSVRPVPGPELRRSIGAEEEGPGHTGLAVAEAQQRLDRVGGAFPSELRALHREAGRPGDGQLQHRGPVGGGGGVTAALEGLLARRDEPQLVEAERFGGDLADDQMAVVDGIERAAEEADGGHGARPRKPSSRAQRGTLPDTPGTVPLVRIGEAGPSLRSG